MSNSSYANYVNRQTPNYTDRTTMIDSISIHTSGVGGDIYDAAELINQSMSTSYHYAIDSDGTIGLFVDEKFSANSIGSKNADDRAVSILVMNEIEDYDKLKSQEVSRETYEALIKLCTDICRRNYILELKYTGNPEDSNLLMHSWYAKTDCPGKWLTSHYPDIARKVTTNLLKASGASSELEQLKTSSTIAVKAINPYVVILDDYALGVDYFQLRNSGVVGTLLHAGDYFDENHNKRSRFRTTNIKQQVYEADYARMPYALYTNVRAKSVEEAKKEIYELYFLVSKYPPKLGLWLKIDFKTSSNTAVEILEVYYKYIVRWGLKSKCGIYCTKEQCKMIQWNDFSDRFALWLNEPTTAIDMLDDLMVPQFFRTEV